MNKVFGLFFIFAIPLLGYFYFLEDGRDVPLIPGFQGELKPLVSIGDVPVRVDVADNPSERQLGLSGRDNLPATEGLLFVFPESDYHGIWMKDMRFPIDVIWIDEHFKVIDITRNLKPETFPRIFEPRVPARFIIETNSNFTASFGIKIGDAVAFPEDLIPGDLQ